MRSQEPLQSAASQIWAAWAGKRSGLETRSLGDEEENANASDLVRKGKEKEEILVFLRRFLRSRSLEVPFVKSRCLSSTWWCWSGTVAFFFSSSASLSLSLSLCARFDPCLLGSCVGRASNVSDVLVLFLPPGLCPRKKIRRGKERERRRGKK